MNINKKIINIVFKTEENDINPLLVGIVSMLENANKKTKYNINIISNSNYSQQNIDILFKLKLKYDVDITFNKINYTNKKNINDMVKMISNCLNDLEKCIYLDHNIIVQRDLEELYNFELNNNHICGVKYENDEVNSSVLLLDCNQIRNANKINIANLDLKYNLSASYFQNEKSFNFSNHVNMKGELVKLFHKQQIKSALKENVIFSYTDKVNPFNSDDCSFVDVWKKYENLGNVEYLINYNKHMIEKTINENDKIINLDFSNNEKPTEGADFYETRKIFADSFNPKKIIISILTWNQLNKTKKCVEYLLKYTSHIDFDLVFFDNNSDDETVEFLKSVEHPSKTIFSSNKNMGIAFALNYLISTSKCEYYININNDCYVTENWLDNILECFKSDEKIAFVTPMSSNMSNFQDPQIKFSDLKEMQEKAAKFNKLDSTKWKERYRLIGAVTCYRKHIFDLIGIMDSGFIHNFSDDDISLRIARSGYKQILAGDVFIHHDHDHSKQDQEKFKKALGNGRQNFIQKYKGIDSWEDLANYEFKLLELASYSKDNNNILGIDIKSGVALLEIKNKLKEKELSETKLSAFTTNAKYYNDLIYICDSESYVKCDRIDFIMDHYEIKSFDYIMLGEYINSYSKPFDLIIKIISLLKDGGQVLFKLKNTFDINSAFKLLGQLKNNTNENYIDISVEEISTKIKSLGYDCKVSAVSENIPLEIRQKLEQSLLDIPIMKASNLNHIYTKEFLFCVRN